PYDQFVRELVAARGLVWENGAIGYYIRDRGMPLDNMSNTVRIFLGVRLECAQCHNHPFDKWTQMDYFKMAAFSYGMDAARYETENRTYYTQHQRAIRTKMHEKFLKKAGYENKRLPMIASQSQVDRYKKDRKKFDTYLKRYEMSEKEFDRYANKSIAAYKDYESNNRGARDAMNELYRPLRYINTSEREKTLKLPHDYQYTDAKPFDAVEGATMFGTEIDLENIDGSTIDAYAGWMTSKDNPTFTKVIANRLWKRVFGHGVFEPLDELTDHTQVANPELLSYLEKVMRELDYDMRTYMEVLYNTKTYQRASNTQEMVLGEPYHFQGPVLRRMTAEQIWDSIVALALPEADNYRPRLKSQLTSVEQVKRIYYALEKRDPEEYVAMVDELAKALGKNYPEQQRIREEMYEAREAEDEEKYRELRAELGTLQREARSLVSDIGYKHVGEKVDGNDLLAAVGMTEMNISMGDDGAMNADGESGAVLTRLPQVKMTGPPAELTAAPPKDLDRDQLRKWRSNQANAMKKWKYEQSNELKYYKGLVSQMARASELESPARRGHFLREFGQSDREVIENAAYHASVPQALNLLNGSIVEALTNKYAVFGKRIHEAGDPDEKTKMIFQAMLTREPNKREMELARNEIEQHGDNAYEGLVWALLNTQQFIFVQ
ncbi:MAG: DUF1553 domain-containing protein, partial [Verrucomicrobiales bacterium]|nr:DUF1553 domain-containing protein [Verrucomicrobiales bacterium]